MSNTVVTIFALSMVVAFIAVDVYLALDKRDGNTYSELLRKAGRVWPPLRLIISFGFGLLAGHWYW